MSNSIRFVPDLEDIPNFETLTSEELATDSAELGHDLLGSELGKAAKTLDDVIANLVKNFSDRTEYFEVGVF